MRVEVGPGSCFMQHCKCLPFIFGARAVEENHPLEVALYSPFWGPHFSLLVNQSTLLLGP